MLKICRFFFSKIIGLTALFHVTGHLCPPNYFYNTNLKNFFYNDFHINRQMFCTCIYLSWLCSTDLELFYTIWIKTKSRNKANLLDTAQCRSNIFQFIFQHKYYIKTYVETIAFYISLLQMDSWTILKNLTVNIH